jgi:hypothetical protein
MAMRFSLASVNGGTVEFEYEVTAASSTAAQAMSSSLMESLSGSKTKAVSFFPRADAGTEGGVMRGAMKISRTKFDAWLAQVAERSRDREAMAR